MNAPLPPWPLYLQMARAIGFERTRDLDQIAALRHLVTQEIAWLSAAAEVCTDLKTRRRLEARSQYMSDAFDLLARAAGVAPPDFYSIPTGSLEDFPTVPEFPGLMEPEP